MTAIAGVWTRAAGPDPNAACARMLTAQAIYGPHASDQWDGGEISLGRRLFELLPEESHDTQPLIGGGGRFVLVADVRLDNRQDLEARLGITADRARVTCDAALLLAAWEKWSKDCFDRLVGCYAFALWDRERRSLSLARDPIGQRPLHYHHRDGFLAFASMPKGLHVLEEVPRAPDERYARDFLALLPERGTGTFFAGVERVEPGCLVTVAEGGLTSVRHWPPPRRPIKLSSNDDYVEALREQLDRAVRAQFRRAVGGVGAHLSAGLDSSAVATAAARLMAQSGGRVTAFTSAPRVGFIAPPNMLADEAPLAAATAALYPNIDHVVVRSSGRSPTEALDREHFLFDRPILNPCGGDSMYELNRQARGRGITVLLTGTLGNLTLSYLGMDLLAELVARGRVKSWLRLARDVVRAGARGWRGVMYHSLGPWIPGPVFSHLERTRGRYSGGLDHYTALNPALFGVLDYARRTKALGLDPYSRPSTDAWLDRVTNLRHVDLGNYYKGFLGGWGVDYRDPTADRRLIEFCLNIPTEQFIVGGRPRSLARRALVGRVPDVVLSEPKRGYPTADWHEALTASRTELADWIGRLEGCPAAETTLDLPRLGRLVEDWPTDGWERDEVKYPYRYALLRALSVGHFLHKASGSNR